MSCMSMMHGQTNIKSADHVAATKYLEHFNTIIDGMDYLPQQDFYLDSTSQF